MSFPKPLPPLFVAIREGNADELERLLRDDLLNEPHNGRSPLAFAARLERVDIARLLLTAGARVHPKPGEEHPLVMALEGFDHDTDPERRRTIATLLLDAGAKVEREDDAFRAVYSAARLGPDELLDRVLAAGAHVDARYAQFGSRTPLMWACSQAWVGAVERLLARSASTELTDREGQAPLGHVVVSTDRSGHPWVGGWPDEEARAAFQRDRLKVLELLLDAGADPDGGKARRKRPILWALGTGDVRVAALLMSRGAGRRGLKPPQRLCLAAAEGDRAAVLELLDRGAPTDAALGSERGESTFDALALAAGGGHLAVVEALLERGAQPTAQAFGLAARYDHAAVLERLLAAGDLDPLSRPRVLSDAARGKHEAAARVLLRAGWEPGRGIGDHLCEWLRQLAQRSA